jgi:hypothetical protein
MKNKTYDLIETILGGLFLLIVIVCILLALILPINYTMEYKFKSDCIFNNKTYYEIGIVDGVPIKMKYCGDLKELNQMLDKIKEVSK